MEAHFAKAGQYSCRHLVGGKTGCLYYRLVICTAQDKKAGFFLQHNASSDGQGLAWQCGLNGVLFEKNCALYACLGGFVRFARFDDGCMFPSYFTTGHRVFPPSVHKATEKV